MVDTAPEEESNTNVAPFNYFRRIVRTLFKAGVYRNIVE